MALPVPSAPPLDDSFDIRTFILFVCFACCVLHVLSVLLQFLVSVSRIAVAFGDIESCVT